MSATDTNGYRGAAGLPDVLEDWRGKRVTVAVYGRPGSMALAVVHGVVDVIDDPPPYGFSLDHDGEHAASVFVDGDEFLATSGAADGALVIALRNGGLVIADDEEVTS
jgi:hypothetical protein